MDSVPSTTKNDVIAGHGGIYHRGELKQKEPKFMNSIVKTLFQKKKAQK
jgi:hypothetical protein